MGVKANTKRRKSPRRTAAKKSIPQRLPVETASCLDAVRPPTINVVAASVIYPKDAERRYGISLATRWRWEKAARLPPRDFFVGGCPVGWKPATLDAADRGDSPRAAPTATLVHGRRHAKSRK